MVDKRFLPGSSVAGSSCKRQINELQAHASSYIRLLYVVVVPVTVAT